MNQELLSKPYWIIDILPGQVPVNSPGQYFAIEKYFLSEQPEDIRRKHIRLILKLNCYRSIAAEGEVNPPPARIAEIMKAKSTRIRVDGAMILSDPDDTYMTLYNPDGELLALVKALASAEGLFVWQPPKEESIP